MRIASRLAHTLVVITLLQQDALLLVKSENTRGQYYLRRRHRIPPKATETRHLKKKSSKGKRSPKQRGPSRNGEDVVRLRNADGLHRPVRPPSFDEPLLLVDDESSLDDLETYFEFFSSDESILVTTSKNDTMADSPTQQPTAKPTHDPGFIIIITPPPVESDAPTRQPTIRPTMAPTTTIAPTLLPTAIPTASPTTVASTTLAPTLQPTTASPTAVPTKVPTKSPTTAAPTQVPTVVPTTVSPTPTTTEVPEPTQLPTTTVVLPPTDPIPALPTAGSAPPTPLPTTNAPTKPPTAIPTSAPTKNPTSSPTTAPTADPGLIVVVSPEDNETGGSPTTTTTTIPIMEEDAPTTDPGYIVVFTDPPTAAPTTPTPTSLTPTKEPTTTDPGFIVVIPQEDEEETEDSLETIFPTEEDERTSGPSFVVVFTDPPELLFTDPPETDATRAPTTDPGLILVIPLDDDDTEDSLETIIPTEEDELPTSDPVVSTDPPELLFMDPRETDPPEIEEDATTTIVVIAPEDDETEDSQTTSIPMEEGPTAEPGFVAVFTDPPDTDLPAEEDAASSLDTESPGDETVSPKMDEEGDTDAPETIPPAENENEDETIGPGTDGIATEPPTTEDEEGTNAPGATTGLPPTDEDDEESTAEEAGTDDIATEPPTAEDSLDTGTDSASESPAAEDDSTNTDSPLAMTNPPSEPETDSMNDGCQAATPVQVDEVVDGSMLGARVGPALMCGAFRNYNASTLFYTLEGTGEGIHLEIVASFDIGLKVFEGDCNSLTCVTTDTTEGFLYDEDGMLQQSFGNATFLTEVGETYVIAVESLLLDADDKGTFVLDISSGGQAPANSECRAAIPLEAGQIINGATTYSRPYSGIECKKTHTAPGVFYRIEGTGEYWLFATTGFDTQLTLLEGDRCDEELACVATNDDNSANLDLDFNVVPNSAIHQYLEVGQTYYLLVDGFGYENGDFVLYTQAELGENDDCESAQSLELGTPVAGETFWATGIADESFPVCGGISSVTGESRFGVWYSVKGVGGPMVATMQGLAFAVAVYEGETCSNLTCVETWDASFTGNPIVFESVQGQEYLLYAYRLPEYLLYASPSGDEEDVRGNFNITVEATERPANDECRDSIVLEIGDSVVGDTTASLTESKDLESCGDIYGLGYGGLWYSFQGTGDTVLLGLNTSFPTVTDDFDSQLTVYSGDSCGELVCVDGNDLNTDFSSLGLEAALVVGAVEGVTYHVLVHGYVFDRGSFEISLSKVETPSNPTCDSAIAVEVGDGLVGNTLFGARASKDQHGKCGKSILSDTTAAGVWYQVEATGETMVASLSGANFYTQLTVFSQAGSDCTSLQCVDGEQAFATLGAFGDLAVVWETEAGEVYNIFVHGDRVDELGEFELEIQALERPPNDACQDAAVAKVGEPFNGSTQYALPGDLSECGLTVQAPTVWYKIDGSTAPVMEGEGVTSGLSVSISNYNADHRVSIFSGDECGNLSCLEIGVALFLPNSAAVGASISWEAQAGETYYVAVSDRVGHGPLDFDIVVEVWAVAKKSYLMGQST